VKGRKALIHELDEVFSDLILARDGYKCQRCGKQYSTKPGLALQCSHYFKRGLWGTRWDQKNCVAFCYGCHRLVEGDKQGWYADYMEMRVGKIEMGMLRIKAYAECHYKEVDLAWLLEVIKVEKDKYEQTFHSGVGDTLTSFRVGNAVGHIQ